MLVGETAEYIAKIVWTTSDAGAKKLHGIQVENNCGNNTRLLNVLMKEYFYLKAGLAARLIYQSTDNTQDAEILLTSLKDKFQILFSATPYEYTWGSSYPELLKRIDEYLKTLPNRELNEVQKLFRSFITDSYGHYVGFLLFTDVLGFVEDVEHDLKRKLVNYQNGRSGGCGCFSVVACFSLLLIVVLVWACF